MIFIDVKFNAATTFSLLFIFIVFKREQTCFTFRYYIIFFNVLEFLKK